MKNLIYIASFALLLQSCQADKPMSTQEILESNDQALIEAKKLELADQYSKLSDTINQINLALESFKTEADYPLIETYTVQEMSFSHFIELQGDVDTKQNIIVYPEFSGVLSQVYVKEGDRVKKNQLLAKIEDGGLSQQLAQMEINFELAKTTFERQQRLWDQKIGSEMQFLQAKASYESQERAIKQFQDQLERTYVRAPFTGIVDDVFTEQGQVVNPGQNQLMRIVNLDHMYINAEVPEIYVASIKKGTKAQIYFNSLGKEFNAKVRQVGSFINPANRTFKIEIPVNNKDHMIKPNLIASISLNDYSNANALVIPSDIIQEDAQGQTFVYAINRLKNKNIASLEKKYIQPGFSYDGLVEVISGLDLGDQIVSEGAKNIREGVTVSIKQ
ncbi:MAG: efflux RND transporter periplasmic adaptor subunit [Flavobacteriaceae bacterium]